MKLLSDEPAVQQARAHSGRIVRALNDLAALVQEAWDKRYDRVLKYKSWQAYCLGEFGSGETAIRARQIVTVMLRGEDLTEKAIAEQLGVSQPTVNRDLSEQDDYSPSHHGSTGDERRARRREQRQAVAVMTGGYAGDMLDTERPPLTWSVPPDQWRPGAGPGAVRVQYEPAAIEHEPATPGQLPAAITDQPARVSESAADQDQPAIGGQPAAGRPELPAARGDQPATEPVAWERFLQGDTDGARAEIRRRVLAGQPVRREQLHTEFGVSEMFARQATAVEEEAALQARLGPSEMQGSDTEGNCARELAAVRDRYPRVLTRSPWIADCLQLVIDTLSEQQ